MDVKFITTTSSRLPEMPVVNGQLIYLSDINATFYDMAGIRVFISSTRLVDELPTVGQENILYCIINNAGHIDSYMWDPVTSTYKQLSGYAATTTTLGLVKVDGTTITIDSNGTISGHPPVETLPASAITYDNTISGLSATNVQLGLDELTVDVNSATTTAESALTMATGATTALESLELRVVALEQIAAIALTTEPET